MPARIVPAIVVLVWLAAAGVPLCAQVVPVVPGPAAPPPVQSAPAAAPTPPRLPIPLKVDVLLMRFKGTEKVGSLPSSLSVVDSNRAMLRLGSSVPVPQTSFPVAEGGATRPVTSYHYQEVGISIDVNVNPLPDGRYRLALVIEDTSLGEGASLEGVTAKLPVIRRYRLETQVVTREGQVSEFNMSTDRVTGETIRAQVTLTVLK